MSRPALIAGAGGFARAVLDSIRHFPEFRAVGFLDDRHGELSHAHGLPILGTTADLHAMREIADELLIAVGSPIARRAIFATAIKAGFSLPSLIHPRAYVAADALVGSGVIIMAGAVVGAGCTIGEGSLINSGAVLDHDCVLGCFSHIGISASMGGGARLADGATLAQGQVLKAGQGCPPNEL